MKQFWHKNKKLSGLLFILLAVVAIGVALPQPKQIESANMKLTKVEYDPFDTEYALTKEQLLQKRYMLIEFFTLQCPHCERSIPLLNELQKHKDLSVVGYTMESSSKVKEYAKKHDVRYPLSRASVNYMNIFEPVVVPMSFLIDTQTMEVKEKFLGKFEAKSVLEIIND